MASSDDSKTLRFLASGASLGLPTTRLLWPARGAGSGKQPWNFWPRCSSLTPLLGHFSATWHPRHVPCCCPQETNTKELDAISYYKAIDACSAGSEWEARLQLRASILQVQHGGSRTSCYSYVLDLLATAWPCCRAFRPSQERALQLLGDMVESQIDGLKEPQPLYQPLATC